MKKISVPTAILSIALAVVSAISITGFSDAAAAAPAEQMPIIADQLDAGTNSLDQADLASLTMEVVPVPASLDELVDVHTSRQIRTAEGDCLASAIYFEARGESLTGQLAVAEVILNRAEHRGWRSTICAVVTQPSQFSFVRNGRIPAPARNTLAWRRAVAISFIAREGLWETPASEALYFHADYVSPRWRTAFSRQAQLGTHIFYR
ncbi:cell wall hydrolase [Erythrobacter aureus]|uniref:Cell wall hydrolase n=1 Tax=Erythrobacter aureus TaxID=2182384 RepID=A0A345YIW8_9SPHN|nr:cell wall hydrolase [Erythrobacter aureus]AXK43870.1 cell wall hydrolase [Erythrobacter aureus]